MSYVAALRQSKDRCRKMTRSSNLCTSTGQPRNGHELMEIASSPEGHDAPRMYLALTRNAHGGIFVAPCLLVLCLLNLPPLQAQNETTGGLTVTVTDQSHALVIGAPFTLEDDEKGIVLKGSRNSTGTY